MKRLLINASFTSQDSWPHLKNHAIIIEVFDNFKGDLEPIIHKKLVEINQKVFEKDSPYYKMQFTAQRF